MAIQLNKIDEEYYLIVNHPELYKRARELKYMNAVLLTDGIDIADIMAMKESGKSFALVFYDEADLGTVHDLRSTLRYEYGINCLAWSLPYDWDLIAAEEMCDLKDSIRLFPTKTFIEKCMVHRGFIRDTADTAACSNCNA